MLTYYFIAGIKKVRNKGGTTIKKKKGMVCIFSIILTMLLFVRAEEKNIALSEEELKKLIESSVTTQLKILEDIETKSIDEQTFQALSQLLIESKDINVLGKIARILGKDSNIPTQVKVDTILNALKREIEKPTMTEFPEGSYAPGTEYLKMQYEFAIEDLGKSAIPEIKRQLEEAKGEFREWLLITLGALGDVEFFSQIVEILESSKDGFIRSFAARSLGILGNKQAISALKKALEDPFFTISSTCLRSEDPEFNKIYPVREEASNALKKMGISVKRQGNKFWIEESI